MKAGGQTGIAGIGADLVKLEIAKSGAAVHGSEVE